MACDSDEDLCEQRDNQEAVTVNCFDDELEQPSHQTNFVDRGAESCQEARDDHGNVDEEQYLEENPTIDVAVVEVSEMPINSQFAILQWCVLDRDSFVCPCTQPKNHEEDGPERWSVSAPNLHCRVEDQIL